VELQVCTPLQDALSHMPCSCLLDVKRLKQTQAGIAAGDIIHPLLDSPQMKLAALVLLELTSQQVGQTAWPCVFPAYLAHSMSWRRRDSLAHVFNVIL
jgi:hypothetical protein